MPHRGAPEPEGNIMSRYVTATTTDEALLAPVKSAKQTLAQKATDAVTDDFLLGDRLVVAAQAVMCAEAVASAAFTYRNMLANGADAGRRKDYLFSLMRGGADDTWSGRSNDARRSAFDSVREWADRQYDAIDHA